MKMTFDTTQLDRFAQRLEGKTKEIQEKVVDKSVKAVSAEVLRRAILLTPRSSNGGNLARSWYDHSEGYKTSSKTGAAGHANKYVDSGEFKILHSGKIARASLYNTAEYSVYQEFGHRTVDHRGWVPGRFFMTNAVEQTQKFADGIVEEVVNKYMNDLLN